MTHEITAISSRAQEICVSTAQRYAAAAYDDGLTEDTLRALASLACWGKHQQNVERDFHRWMPYAHGSRLTTHSTVIEVYDPDTASVQQKEIPILLASDVLHSLWSRQSDKLWDVCVGVTSEKTSAFWTAAQHDWASAHPVVKPSGCVCGACGFCCVQFFKFTVFHSQRLCKGLSQPRLGLQHQAIPEPWPACLLSVGATKSKSFS